MKKVHEIWAWVPPEEFRACSEQYASRREQENRLKALSRGPAQTRYYQLGQLDLVTHYWSSAIKRGGTMERVMATPWEQPTQPLVASYDLQAGSGSILLTPESTRGLSVLE